MLCLDSLHEMWLILFPNVLQHRIIQSLYYAIRQLLNAQGSRKNVFRDTLKKEIKTGQPPYTMTLQNHKNVNFWGQKVAEIVVKLG